MSPPPLVGIPCTSRTDVEKALASDEFQSVAARENALVEAHRDDERFSVDGYCEVCERWVAFLVDHEFGASALSDRWLPNWRERLACGGCQLNNRQRLIATLVKQACRDRGTIYFMEQVTAVYRWAVSHFGGDVVIGSEFVDAALEGGRLADGIRHEDAQSLSFGDASLEAIVSNDVMEHVPDYEAFLGECSRVLAPGGELFMTIPFHSERDASRRRARLSGGAVEHLCEPEFHGNPMSPEGSLVYHDFGWDVLESMRSAGLAGARIEMYVAHDRGHLGVGQLAVFRATRVG